MSIARSRPMLTTVKVFLRNNPTTLQLLFKARKPGIDRRRVHRGDDLVIEGYPRSANTFALNAFQWSQPAPLKVGNHLHSAGQILLAQRWGIPAIVPLRDPFDACLSLMVFGEGRFDAPLALGHYIGFHTPLLQAWDHFVVAPFSEITSDFGALIRRANARFGTAFTPFEATEDNVAAVQALMRDKARKRGHDPESSARFTLPNDRKKALSEQYRSQLEHPSVAADLGRAKELHDRFLAHPSLG